MFQRRRSSYFDCLLIFIISCQFGNTITAQGSYSIIAPNTLRPNSQYHVAVTVHESVTPAKIKLGILGSTYSDFKIIELRPQATELVHFNIPELKADSYKLTAEGLSGITFTNETHLSYNSREFTVLFQTDKPTYKPGDVIYYRILLLDPFLKPAANNYGRAHLELRDAGNNIIRSYKDIRFNNGVYASKLQLSESPKLGQWSINLNVGDERYGDTFDVVEYILPKFIIDIETSKRVIYKNNRINGTIKAYYPFGKKIKGEATISIYPTFFGSLQPFINDLITRNTLPIDGEAPFDFGIKDELNLKEDYEREYLIDVLVEEKSTGSVQNFSSVITVYLYPYRVEAVRLPRNYIPGVPFEVTAKVLRNDGAPMGTFNREIRAYLTDAYGSSEVYNKTTYDLDGNAEVKMNFTVPRGDNDEYHSVIVEYLGTVTDIGKVPRKHLHGKSAYITAKVLNDKPLINRDISVRVESNEPMRHFVYQVVGRGDILLSRSVDVGYNSSHHTFKFLSTSAMAPRSKLLISMVTGNNELIYDEQTIHFEEIFVNSVQIDAPLRAPPGQNIDIKINAKPHSFVGLMAIDQNLEHLKKDSDILYETVVDALNLYEPVESPGSQGPGVITMSNARFSLDHDYEQSTPAAVKTASAGQGGSDAKLTTVRKTDIGPAHIIETNTLAPGKGRYAFSYTPKPFWHNPRVHFMHAPASPWFFANMSSGSDGRITLHQDVPSSMTSWVISAFSLDPVTGLGIAKRMKNVQAYKEFYITTDLPYSIRKGEIIALPFVVFNDKDYDLKVEVTLYNTAQEFQFLQLDGEQKNSLKIELYSRRSIDVPAKGSASVSFIVAPKKVGRLNVKATATSQYAGDSVERTLLVEHPGATESRSRAILFQLSSQPHITENVTIRIPRNAIPESSSIEVLAVGDVFASVFGNVDRLIRLPTGCGEQSLVNFVPNILALKYMEDIRSLDRNVQAAAKKNLELGYQNLLYFRHSNGGFSVFGLSEEGASTWLTAYAASALRQASNYVQIDENAIRAALKFLASMQTDNGDFEEKGYNFQEFDDRGLSLTSVVTSTFLDNANLYSEYKNHIYKALDFIARTLDGSSHLRSMAIGSYVLSRAKHNAKAAFLQRLDSMAVYADGKKWWNETAPPSEHSSPWYNRSRSVNIEITSYAVLALLENNLLADALPAIKWLVDQRNDLGGFVGTQDTVVGLQALMEFAKRFSSQANNVQVKLQYGNGIETVFNVNEENSRKLQRYELPNGVREVNVSATGSGMALAHIVYKYNTNVTSAWPRFVLDPTVNRNSHADYLHLSVCASFVPTEDSNDRSNMAVMEVYLPSGFVVDMDTLPSLESSERIKKVETQRMNTVVIIYFDYLTRQLVCPTLHAYKTIKVTNHQPVQVVMYDYYDNVKKARQFYRAPKSNLCDICEDSSCGSLCERTARQEAGVLDENGVPGGRSINDGSSISSISPTFILMPMMIGVISRLI